jgi:hypothetical protein
MDVVAGVLDDGVGAVRHLLNLPLQLFVPLPGQPLRDEEIQ